MKALNFIYFAVTALVIVWILYNRKNSKPSKLNLRAGYKNLPDLVQKTKGKGGPKSLDCLFMYNGHEFNAYEVLGIPAGSPIAAAEVAYETLKSTTKSDHDFFHAAFDAIKKH